MTGHPDPVAVTRAFVAAIVWGEHTTIWELLSTEGRAITLAVAQSNGLDPVVAGRIRDDLADPVERSEFLRQLVLGLRRDLRSVDIERLEPSGPSVAQDDGTALVELVTPSDLPGQDGWAAGTIHLSGTESGSWLVDRLDPRLAGP